MDAVASGSRQCLCMQYRAQPMARPASRQRVGLAHCGSWRCTRKLLLRAQDEQQQQAELDAEARLSALEMAAKRGKKGGSAKVVKEMQDEAARQQREAEAFKALPGNAEWKEGSLVPEGWEGMDPVQRATELWMGKRGMMYWMTQSAWYSAGILAFAWVVFRFVGPALGLYDLAGGLPPV